MRRALVVAHCDDESLWFGGLLAAEPGDWTVVACSIPRADPVRAWKFFSACDVLGAKARLLPFVETGAKEPLPHLGMIGLSQFDQIVTHNAVGEYGHYHHCFLNKALTALYPDKVVTGGYGKAPGAKRIVLNEHQLGIKMGALRCYDHTSPMDGSPKWRALLDRYGSQFDLGVETYDR
jgi:hypothetical protein